MINSAVEMDKHLFVSTLIIYFVLAVILHCAGDKAIGFTLCIDPYSDRLAIAVERMKTESNSVKLKPVYNWKSQYGGMESSDIKQMKGLEEENRRLKPMYASLLLEHELVRYAIRGVTQPWLLI